MIADRLVSALHGLARVIPPPEAKVHARKFQDGSGALPTAIEAERHQIQTADAGLLSYYADTAREGRPLVLLHGIHAAASSYGMRPLFDSLRGERRVYALDLPGFGFSERSDRKYTPATYVHAIEHLLRNVTTRQGADVVALSLTCEYAAKVAVEMPELVHSLVLISPTGFASEREAGGLEKKARMGQQNRLAQLISRFGGQRLFDLLVTRPSLRFYLSRSFSGPIDEELLAYDYATSHRDGASHAPLSFVSGELFPKGDPKQLYARVQAPTLVLHDQDAYTGFGELEAFVRDHELFRSERITPTRGLPQFEAREQTVAAMRSFWEGIAHAPNVHPGDGLQGRFGGRLGHA